jgi:hypothetical protein
MSKISAGTTQLTSLKFDGDTTGVLELGSGAGVAITIETDQTLTLGEALPIASGGTGQTTANTALNALLPSQTGNAGRVLQTDGTDTSWVDISPAINPVTINSTTIATAISIASGENGFSVGPMTVGTGGSVTVASGQQWVIF